jgi:predicted nucleic acid-binding protein
MSFLVDTNVISEATRPRPDDGVVRWLKSAGGSSLFVSVLTLGEIRKGIEKLRSGARKDSLRAWLESEIPAWFEGRILPVDAAVADRWGRLVAAAGRTIPAVDSLIAATALVHGLRLVTRDRADYSFPGLEILDPWEPPG